MGHFDQPLYVTAPPGDHRLFVVEKPGTVQIVRDGAIVKIPFLDIRDQVSTGAEQGLLSIAFAPDYTTSRLVYVDYTDTAGTTQVVEYETSASDPDAVDLSTRRSILTVTQPFPNHNGGLVLFDPSGALLVGLGDGGSGGDPGNRAQNINTLLGKLLRIDPRHHSGGKPYTIPPDNPFVGRRDAKQEIWAYGLRNPWRFTFDPATKNLIVADVGQDRVEEIDVVAPKDQPKANYGWRAYEGDLRFTGDLIDESHLVRPAYTYPHKDGACSITGGVVYGGSVASLRGRYLFGDFCTGRISAAVLRASGIGSVQPLGDALNVMKLSSFGQDGQGEAYVVSLDGDVSEIVNG